MNKYTRIISICPLILLLLFHFPSGKSWCNDLDQSYLFDIKSSVELSIKADISHLINNREVQELPAKVVFSYDNTKLELNGTVEVRGNFRRDPKNCDFPPLRLRFKDSEIKGTVLDGNHNLKIVTHCKDKSNQFLQFIAKELTTYQIYNLISPYSLKVKMVNITYIDEQNDLKTILNEAFLIEDIDRLAEDHNMKEYEGNLSDEEVDQDILLQLSVFQFMIGNTDWIIPLSKNLKFITDGEVYIPVPYDFDYTAIVGTNYNIGGGISYLVPPERKFKGPCYDTSTLAAEFEEFKDKRESILNLVSTSPLLKAASKKNMKNYIDEFFEIIGSEEKIGEYFQINCK